MRRFRLMVAAVGVTAATLAAGAADSDAFPWQCSARIHSSRTASGYCAAGTSGDQHRVWVNVYNPYNGGRYYGAVGPWRSPGSASPITVPSGHRIVKADNHCRDYVGAAVRWC